MIDIQNSIDPTLAMLRSAISHAPVEFTTHENVEGDGFRRLRIEYHGDEGDVISAFLFLPLVTDARPAIVFHHQHNGERHIGKSEVAGLAGDPLQAFGPALARKGFVVLAPDSICFEDRRPDARGIEPDPEGDWLQHLNQMSYRILTGDLLLRKILSDASRAVSLLAGHPAVDPVRIGVAGHSYGGNTTIFQAALDGRIRFACTSGAACTFRTKMEEGTGIELAWILPGVIQQFDIDDVVSAIAPRKLLIVSASEDVYSRDADDIFEKARQLFLELGALDAIAHYRYAGGHAMTMVRFEDILSWLERHA